MPSLKGKTGSPSRLQNFFFLQWNKERICETHQDSGNSGGLTNPLHCPSLLPRVTGASESVWDSRRDGIAGWDCLCCLLQPQEPVWDYPAPATPQQWSPNAAHCPITNPGPVETTKNPAAGQHSRRRAVGTSGLQTNLLDGCRKQKEAKKCPKFSSQPALEK